MTGEASKPDMGVAELFGLKDKGVLITGATSLISLWTARLLLDVGARVVMTDRLDEQAIRAAMGALAAEQEDPRLDLADQVELVGSVDVRNRKPADIPAHKASSLVSVEQLVREAVDRLGSIDVLINMAGGQEPVPAAALATEVLRRTVDRILIGTI